MPGISFEQPAFETAVPVVVIGAGACGMTAALAARDAGAEVVVLERDARPHGSTGMSQGYVCAAGTRLQAKLGVADDPDRFHADILAKTDGTADPALARIVADAAAPTVDWLMEVHGIPFELNPDWAGFFGHSTARMHGMPSRTGTELLGALGNAAERAGVDLVTGARVTTLFADRAGRVTGLEMARGDGRTERLGCDALVLATCGFGGNREMVREFIPGFGNAPRYRYFGHEGNQGDAIAWGRGLGAGLGSMTAFQGYGALAEPQAVVVNYDMIMAGGIQVNLAGERFANEIANISAQALTVLAQREGIAWMLFDGPREAAAANLPEHREVLALGAVRRAGTVAELAAAIRVPADALQRTLDEVAAMAAGRIPDPFGRDFTGLAPLAPPFGAVRVTGALFHTQGGLTVDGDARVCRPDGTALPNLFAGGGAAQSISGDGATGYLPAAGLCTAVTLGRLAGAAAARLAREGRRG